MILTITINTVILNLLGISAGASLGVALVILGTQLFGISLTSLGTIGNYSTIVAACLGAGIVTRLVILAARRVQNSTSLLMLGLLFGYGTRAMVDLLLYFTILVPPSLSNLILIGRRVVLVE